MSIELKIKSKHLSEEARIIRFEERKLKKQIQYNKKKYYETGSNTEYPIHSDIAATKRLSLSRHRKWDVRNENRATFLARAYIAGKPYSSVEQKRKPEKESDFNYYILPRVYEMILKYHTQLTNADREYDKGRGRYMPTKALKDKITAWSTLD